MGGWLLGFCGNTGEKDILFAELMGTKSGLIQAWDLGVHATVCESELFEAVHLAGERTWGGSFHHHGTVIANIKSLMATNIELVKVINILIS